MLPEIGVAGQERLKAARVLCLGAGGLGSPAALYLAAAGIGTIGLVDDDRVALSISIASCSTGQRMSVVPKQNRRVIA